MPAAAGRIARERSRRPDRPLLLLLPLPPPPALAVTRQRAAGGEQQLQQQQQETTGPTGRSGGKIVCTNPYVDDGRNGAVQERTCGRRCGAANWAAVRGRATDQGDFFIVQSIVVPA